MYRLSSFAILTTVFGFIGMADGQSKPPIEITDVRLGFPPGPFVTDIDEQGNPAPMFKSGAFTPIFVDLTCHEAVEGPLTLTVQTTDPTDLLHTYTVPLPPIAPGESLAGIELPDLPYTKPGSRWADLRITVRAGDDVVGRPFSETYLGLQSAHFVILTAGSRLPEFRLPQPPGEAVTAQNKLDFGMTELAGVTNPRELPDQWFGYEAVDLMILTTGNAEFVQDLFTARDSSRRDALNEWVRHGGQLIVSVGRNADIVAQLPALQEILPANLLVGERRNVPSFQLSWTNPGSEVPERYTLTAGEGSDIPLAVIKPKIDRSVRVLMSNQPRPEEGVPLIVQASYGLGRVTLVGFDLDRPPFSEWSDPAPYWRWLVTEAGGEIPEDGQGAGFNDRFYTSNRDQELISLQRSLEYFEGVPVISFGWVALFILLYILIIGPLDYLFLKKVVKRLEFTWITFPIVVIVVSTLAYFTAYALKGKDLKVNKIDLVDIDLQTKRVYGSTWSTVFSPRIQNYTIGVEPASPTWTPAGAEETSGNVLVSWLGTPNEARQSFFRRSYSYHVDPAESAYANGLVSVPIQVWSTKSFSSRWSAPIDDDKPLIVSDLQHPPGDPETLSGSITNNLPVEAIENAQLIYRDKIYPLGRLIRGGTKQVVLGTKADPPRDWLSKQSITQDISEIQSFPARRDSPEMANYRLWPILFHEALDTVDDRFNDSLRHLDQSWRLSEDNRNEAILLGWIPPEETAAEEMMTRDSTPTRLWLNAIPGEGIPREPLQGTLRQETYIRVFIPITPAGN